MIFTIILFLVGFVFLVKGANFLVDGSSSVAKRFRVPEIVIGLTIVAFGTSLPELVVNIIASLQGNADIALGNIIGSNIANTLLILGASAVVYKVTVTRATTWKEIPFTILATIVLFILSMDALVSKQGDSVLTRGDGILLLLFFCIFLYYIFEIIRNNKEPASAPQHSTLRSTCYILLGLLGLILGGKWVVDGAVQLAGALGVSERIIGLTIVSVGTSLPELVTSIVAAAKRQHAIAVGNIVGSNLFNIFFILGISAVITPIAVSSIYLFDLLVLVGSALLLFGMLFAQKNHELRRGHGILLLLCYVGYVVYLVVR
jgi:cation:H+ antiporter